MAVLLPSIDNRFDIRGRSMDCGNHNHNNNNHNSNNKNNNLFQRVVMTGSGMKTEKPVTSLLSGWNYTSSRFLSSSSNHCNNNSPAAKSCFAVVDHGTAYEESMQGRHGKQLSLAELEGLGKDDPPFDPFAEEEEEYDDDDEYEYDEEEDDQEQEIIVSSKGQGSANDVQEQSKPPQQQQQQQKDYKSMNGREEDEDDDDEYHDDEDEEEDDDDDTFVMENQNQQYKNDGSLRWKPSALAKFRAGAPSGGAFAIIELVPGSQHKVTLDDVIVANLLKPISKYKLGSIHTLKNEQVLLMGSSHLTLVGMPSIQGAEVDVMIEEITKDKKVIVFKKRRRKHSQRRNGFRRDITLLRVIDIRFPEPYQNHHHVEREMP